MLQSDVPVHLAKSEKIILSGADWNLASADWVILQLCEGVVYAINRHDHKEIPIGGVLICPPKSDLTMTASVLGRAVLRSTAIRASSLAGLLTAVERQCLETSIAQEFKPFVMLPPEHPFAERLGQIFAGVNPHSFVNRLGIVFAFAELIGPKLLVAVQKMTANEQTHLDAKGRLRQIIGKVPESELSNLSLGEMAKMLHCCERHASRLFREEWGTGFISYVSEIRLKKACDLLRQGNQKIIDVALESGHGSLAHFNYAFKKRFRLTPTEWRERHAAPPRPVRHSPRARPLQIAAAIVWLLCSVAGMSNCWAAAGSGSTNAPAAPAELTFKLDHYVINGNTLLPSNLISQVLAPYTGEAVTTNTVAKALGALQSEYFLRGYVNVKVYPPPQKVTNNSILFEVLEGTISVVKIQHNRYFSSNNIIAALPYVKTLESGGHIMNANVLQAEVDRANSNPDRQIAPSTAPAPDPGTSALILNVKDELPLHGRLEADNYSPPGTPELRINANLSYDNLWQLDHSVGFQYGFSPEEMKPSTGNDTHLSYNPLDTPEVSYYSAFYRAPLGAPTAVEDQIAQDQTHFGYNETTRQFTLPPSIGRPEFSAFASRSTSGPTIYGPNATVVDTSLLKIEQQLVSQQYTSQTTVGERFSFPLPTVEKIQSTLSFGLDYKNDKVVTLPTNNFYYTTEVTHGAGAAPPTISQSTIAIAGVKTFPSLNYTPLFLGWSGSRQDHWGQFGPTNELWNQFYGSISLTAGTGGIFTGERSFPVLIGNTPEATTEFFAIRPQLSRIQVLPDNFTAYENLAGQWANIPLLNLEQFELGGNGSVRGYREGEFYSDTGWVSQTELRSPLYWRGASSMKVGTQFTAFSDYGKGYHLDEGGSSQASQALWGMGMGVNFNFGRYVQSHVIIAWPMLDSLYTKAGHERISFSMSAQL
jgi:hemolysin activation/secretion protein/AraC-like DNA-binding protein